MFKPQLSIAFRQARIKDQLQAANEIALANLVLSHDDDTFPRLDINIREIGEIDQPDPRNPHLRPRPLVF
ncbi:hypothetical protein WK34_05655 [Burkholderia vietnamiensis]|nr:hypothetical protein WK34_05655 [Burkholderia vietnamiensis]